MHAKKRLSGLWGRGLLALFFVPAGPGVTTVIKSLPLEPGKSSVQSWPCILAQPRTVVDMQVRRESSMVAYRLIISGRVAAPTPQLVCLRNNAVLLPCRATSWRASDPPMQQLPSHCPSAIQRLPLTIPIGLATGITGEAVYDINCHFFSAFVRLRPGLFRQNGRRYSKQCCVHSAVDGQKAGWTQN